MATTLASARLHLTEELGVLQREMVERIQLFDSLVDTPDRHSPFPVRVVTLGSEKRAVQFSQKAFREGFYLSPVFFPIVPRNEAGVRIMIRLGVPKSEILRLAQLVKELQHSYTSLGDET
jgi:7-keto-8-aminopelargonate synthetase-like enzyme